MAAKKRIDIPFILENNEYGKLEFVKLYDEVVTKANLTPAQQNCFIIYCVEIGNYIKLELEILEEGEVILAGNKTPIPNPKVNMKQSALKSFMAAAIQLGITPKSKLKSTTKAKMSTLEILKNKSKNG